MAHKRKEVASASIPSRTRKTRNSNRGKENEYPNERYESLANAERAKTLENRGITHERIISFSEGEPDFMHDRIEALAWGFMYNAFILINLNIVREFYSNFSAPSQIHVFLRGQGIPFSEEAIRRHLDIPYELPPLDEDDIFKKTVRDQKEGNLNMADVLQVIGKEGVTWANNPDDTTIPKRLDHAIMNAKATAWHKLIMANIDPKTHAHHLPHGACSPYLCADDRRLANQYQVPRYARYEIVKIQEVDIYCPYGNWKAERLGFAMAGSYPHSRHHRWSPKPSMKDIMRYMRRQEHLQHNTQTMIRQAFPDKEFTGLIPVSSVERGSKGGDTEVLEESDAES
ncbi:hypothetical protein PIB30_081435 [Stylosanthes scabra]|uniref:Putative plant transposon protein domain-containing protein n=1 Tax=Stylosanthes scabra TaxID=79078 RepID=A0ABU6XTY5_9FABA|nr:hypothetical protein [Stylosanthes scabra]